MRVQPQLALTVPEMKGDFIGLWLSYQNALAL